MIDTNTMWSSILFLMCQSFTGKYRSSIVRHIVCINHLLGNTEVALYITLYVSIIYWEIPKLYCTSHIDTYNVMYNTTSVFTSKWLIHTMWRTILLLYFPVNDWHSQSFTGKYRSSIVHHIVRVNHLLGNTEVALYTTLSCIVAYKTTPMLTSKWLAHTL
jgi:hypothetical protein